MESLAASEEEVKEKVLLIKSGESNRSADPLPIYCVRNMQEEQMEHCGCCLGTKTSWSL